MSVERALAEARSFFLAGVMQGSRPGADMVDQGYRNELRTIIGELCPDAEVRDPAELMAAWIGPEAQTVRAAHARLAAAGTVLHEELEPSLGLLTSVFDRLVRVSADSDVCVAWLPDQEASMGTAVEMWAAHARGRTVVAVSPMRQNLAVLACSDAVVPTVDAFSALLRRARFAHPRRARARGGLHG
jgi:hypothetical protein